MSVHPRDLSIEDRMKGMEDRIPENHKTFPVTPDLVAELDRRLATYEIDKNRGRPAAVVLAALRRSL